MMAYDKIRELKEEYGVSFSKIYAIKNIIINKLKELSIYEQLFLDEEYIEYLLESVILLKSTVVSKKIKTPGYRPSDEYLVMYVLYKMGYINSDKLPEMKVRKLQDNDI